MNQLEKARRKINEIDQEMAKLFEKRMTAVEEVVEYKKEHQLAILDRSREQFVIDHNSQYIQEEKYKEYYKEMMVQLMAISRQYQKTIIHHDCVGYQGMEGAFSYSATLQLFPDYQLKHYDSFEEVFDALEHDDIAYGIVPIQNSYTGEIGEVLDLLIQYPLYICKNYPLTISQNLLGVKGSKLEDIKQVYSKDHAINQSLQFLKGRGYELIPYPNTAMAAEYVARCNDPTKAAIGSKDNAKLYGLEILASDINTSNQNTTRFIALSKTLEKQGDVFALALIIPHTPGSLSNAMQIIASHGYNMQNIISRPLKSRPWEFYFYLEIEGNYASEKAQVMMEQLKEVCEKVKLLGTYKKG